ncbi:MAG TPA: hypothetical protein VG429_13645 [Casimicrobiaceae bacterium]|jgi:hypothetical protein|nr:hypothetical protein [Casimicrobiaceae bacterium]
MMKTLSKTWLPDAIGICAALAGLALLVAVAATGDAIGRSVTTLIGGGFVFGVLGCGLKQAVARRRELPAVLRAAYPASYAAAPAALVAMPPMADATASEFDEIEHPAFAPVMSLTEAHVERELAERRRQEQRAARTRA